MTNAHAPYKCEGYFDENVFAPSWLDVNYLYVDRVIELGFGGFHETELITANKDNYFSGVPYEDILAGIVPDEAVLLDIQNVSRWNVGINNSADQYIDLSLLPGLSSGQVAVNPNLCGIFVITALLNIDPAYFIVDSWYSNSWIQKHYLDIEEGVSRDEMIPLFEEYGWDVIHPENVFTENTCSERYKQANTNDIVGQDFLCHFKDLLENGYTPIMLTDLSTKYGVLTAEKYFPSKAIGIAEHWVVVLQIVSSKDGFSYVRVYNPYMNREEFYTWNDFFYSWAGKNQEFKDMFYVKPNNFEER